jgi:hypothetical protein
LEPVEYLDAAACLPTNQNCAIVDTDDSVELSNNKEIDDLVNSGQSNIDDSVKGVSKK